MEDGAFFQFLGCGNGGKSITTIGGPIYMYIYIYIYTFRPRLGVRRV